MKALVFLGAIACFCLPAPAVAHDCWHGESHHGCMDCDHDGHHGCQGCTQSQASGTNTTNLQTIEGKITEIEYLPGAGMVEVHLQSGSQNQLVRLAPAGFLKQGGMLLREGDAATVKGYGVSGMEGDVFVATEVRHGDKTLSLRDGRGRPAW